MVFVRAFLLDNILQNELEILARWKQFSKKKKINSQNNFVHYTTISPPNTLYASSLPVRRLT